jgi:hypothetical protein
VGVVRLRLGPDFRRRDYHHRLRPHRHVVRWLPQ